MASVNSSSSTSSSSSSSLQAALSALSGSSSSSSSSTTSVGGNTGALSSMGIGSGLNVNSIISAIMAADSQPLTQLQNQASSINQQISAVGKISSLASTLQTAANNLSLSTFFNQTTATSANTGVVTATTSGATATGNYAVTVQQLAQGQTVTMASSASSQNAVYDSGTLTIQLGTWGTGSPPSFTAQAGSNPTTITIPTTANSLSSIASAINAANAGVQATIINDSTGARLSLSSTATGASNGFKITTTDNNNVTGGTALSTLAYDPSTGNAPMTLNQGAQDAKATINGISLQSASNTLSNVTNGLTLTLQSASATPVNVAVAPDVKTMTDAINSFVSAWNALNTEINTDTAYNPSGPVAPGTSVPGGPLEGQPSILSFQQQLRNVINVSFTGTGSGTLHSLSDMGISIQKDGSLQVNSTQLASALQTPSNVSSLLTTIGGNSSNTGLMQQFGTVTMQALGIGGLLAGETDGLQSQLKTNQDEQTQMQNRLNNEQQTLQAQYQALDTTMSQMQALNAYVTQQVTLMTYQNA